MPYRSRMKTPRQTTYNKKKRIMMEPVVDIGGCDDDRSGESDSDLVRLDENEIEQIEESVNCLDGQEFEVEVDHVEPIDGLTDEVAMNVDSDERFDVLTEFEDSADEDGHRSQFTENNQQDSNTSDKLPPAMSSLLIRSSRLVTV